ncbi:MAG: hypothetical protein E7546_05620 [Ruminococcaceae bacterium]|nr:hypothetical protein [Oscillospiraceae bacterium]
MKRLISAVLLCLALMLTLSACITSEDGPSVPAISGGGQQSEAPATVRVTFPEGYNVMQIAQLLEQNGVCTAADFYNTMNTTDFSGEYSFLPPFSELSDRVYYLEGYLYPDTYDFYIGESPASVIRRFLNNFDVKVTDEMIAAASSTGDYYNTSLTFDDVLIMASIVEREIYVVDEMPKCAAVFYNRIKYPNGNGVNGTATAGYLGSDITIYYPYIKSTCPEGFVSEYDTTNGSGNVGLPKGPICCPSINAIKGALYPDHSVNSFFFYIDANAKVYYALTFSEHQANYRYCVENGIAG